MNIEEAIKLTLYIEPEIVIPMHYGMFAENTANPEEFAHELKKSGSLSKTVILNYCKPFIYFSKTV
jgi:L-ascorbate metabolism protein UlaG (beta-lactamase superfamily)